MCNQHSFKSSIREGVSYCINCGCFSYQNIPLNTPKQYQRNVSIDLIDICKTTIQNELIKSRSIHNKNFDPNYFTVRKSGIAYIRLIVNFLQFNQSVIYKAILYLDLIYGEKEYPSFDSIENVSWVCVLFAFQFNENCSKVRNIDYLFEFIKAIPSFHQLEIYCLKILNYDLAHLSCYDYLFNLFTMGIISTNIEPNGEKIVKFNESCIEFMDNLIQDDRFLDFTGYEIALAIVKIQLEENRYKALNTFSLVYGIDYNKPSLMNCAFVLAIIKKYSSAKPYALKANTKTKSISSENVKANSKKGSTTTIKSNTTCSSLDSIELWFDQE